MYKYDVIIIGAGAAGLIAAYDLSAGGKKVLALEARHRIGGRACTLTGNGFSSPVETGAEFVHGKLPVTLSLLTKAGLNYTQIKGRSFSVKNGQLMQEEGFGTGWQALMKPLHSLQSDMTIAEFLDHYFNEPDCKDLRQSVLQFVQGFDAADPAKVSAFSLRNEWTNENGENQYRITKGYSALMQWLADECIRDKVDFKLSHIVDQVNWNHDGATLHCTNGNLYAAPKVLVTIPLGVWQAAPESGNAITFLPALNDKRQAALKMGYGNVIKVNMQFTEKFWETNSNNIMPNAGFIFSDAAFPTWWTQNPGNDPQLNGWLAGPPSMALKHLSEEPLKEKAMESLAYIFGVEKAFIQQKIKSFLITNWADDPYAKGAYSYETLQSADAKRILGATTDNVLFFAGEALYTGPYTGTVEAAFCSGRSAAAELLIAK